MFGFIPNNIELYKLALIHKSASLVLEDGRAINNERLEFLGDAVIEAVTSDYLFIEYPDRDEGFLTQARSKIVSRQSLNVLAVNIGLDRHVISNGSTSVTQKHIYGDAFEAMIGAVYLDQGYEFVNRLLINRIYFRHLSLDEPDRIGDRLQEPADRVVPEKPSQDRFPHRLRQGVFGEPSGFLLHGAGRRHGGRPRVRRFEEGGRAACGFLGGAVHERRAVRHAAGPGGQADAITFGYFPCDCIACGLCRRPPDAWRDSFPITFPNEDDSR